MKKKSFVVVLIIAALVTSCASVSFPGSDDGLRSKLEPKTYDILGDVVIEGTTRSIMGIITWGGATYYDLIQKAKNTYKADDVINVSIDNRATVFLGFYISHTYVIRGIAIKFAD